MKKNQSDPQHRSFLLLQGVASPFFAELEKALIAAGHDALKINFCGGDLLSGRYFSTALKHINFQQPLAELPDFYTAVFSENNITDIALFGDTRPVHQPAIQLAKRLGVRIHVFEEGYFRPNWVTLENGGVNAFSEIFKHSKNNPQWFLEAVKNQQAWQETSEKTGGGLAVRAWHDIRYHIAKTLFKPMFPHYQTHRPDSPLQEYWGFIRRMPAVSLYYKHRSSQQINRLISSRIPYYLLPLQLEADSQIRLHSDFSSLEQVIETTLKSFAQYAPEASKLVIKLHPLDPWFVNYPTIIKRLCERYSIDPSQVIYLEAGDLMTLLENTKGTILVNSTVGTSALSVACPVIALGSAIYDIPGLTFQGSLDEFWTKAEQPDPQLFDAFRQVYIKRTQINGSFYNRKGIQMTVDASIMRFSNDVSISSSNSLSFADSKMKSEAGSDQLLQNSG